MMMRPTNLDIDVLRTLAAAVDHGGFGKAADIIGRSQSAVSLQMRKLEEQVGRPLFRREGRGVVLTEAGDLVLGYGRRMLKLNDEALAAILGEASQESIRFGLPADLADVFLPKVLASFAQRFPNIHIEARVDRNANLVDQANKGQIDLALAFGNHDAASAHEVGNLPIHWIASRRHLPEMESGVPLVMFDAPCLFRDIGISALDEAGKSWRVALTSPSLTGLWAATEAGLGVSIRTRLGVPGNLQVIEDADLLPAIDHSVRLALYRAPRALSKSVSELRDIALGAMDTLLSQAA